ncbi:hypothetical protein L218DRAFT_283305 [Marasmius fiardii PR-910]|nr:hypothetical protein L218DRAFT_283305 [Marasmius fiardii PR-910]
MQHPEESPLKRKKVEIAGPDGFSKSKSVAKLRPRTSISTFQSAFDTGPDSGGIQPKSTSKPRSRASVAPLQVNSEGGTSTSNTVSSTISEPASKPANGSTLSLPAINSPAGHVKPISKALPSSKPLQVAKPPQFQIIKSATTLEASLRPTPKMKVLPPPIMSTLPPNLPSKQLKTLAPPALSIAETSALNQKPIPRFLRIRPATPPPEKPMKTIGTTRVALATDISSDGAAELASILLQQHHVEGESDGHQVPESKWGLQVSPQKGRQNVHGPGVNKFIREGLAAQASSILSHLDTSLALWSKEISMQFSALSGGSLTSSSRLPKPDLRLQIVRIIHTPPPSTPSISSIPGVAICRREVPSKIAPFPLETRSQHASHTEYQYILTLLSFAAHPSPSGTAIRNPVHFKDDKEIWVWKPWRTVSIDGLGDRSQCFSQVFTIENDVDEVSVKRLFASFQDGSTTSTEIPLEDVAYLCDRFVVLR